MSDLRDVLRDVIDNGLIYWEPQTTRGATQKALMIARCEAALAQPEAVEPVEYRWPKTEELYGRECSGGYAHEEKLEWIPAFVKASGVKIEPLYTTPPLAPDERMRMAYTSGVMEANQLVGALWSDLFDKDLVKVEGADYFDKWRDRIKALSRADDGNESEGGLTGGLAKDVAAAAKRVSEWSAAKQDYARRATGSPSDPTPPDATAQREAIARIICYWDESGTCHGNYCVGTCRAKKPDPWCFQAAEAIIALQIRAGG